MLHNISNFKSLASFTRTKRKKPVSVQWTEIRDSILSLHFNRMPINLVRKTSLRVYISVVAQLPAHGAPPFDHKTCCELSHSIAFFLLFIITLQCRKRQSWNWDWEQHCSPSDGVKYLRNLDHTRTVLMSHSIYSPPWKAIYARFCVSRSDSIRNRMWEMPHVGTNMPASVARACVEFLCRALVWLSCHFKQFKFFSTPPCTAAEPRRGLRTFQFHPTTLFFPFPGMYGLLAALVWRAEEVK